MIPNSSFIIVITFRGTEGGGVGLGGGVGGKKYPFTITAGHDNEKVINMNGISNPPKKIHINISRRVHS